MCKNKKEGQSGAIIIEATVALTTFMFAIVSILFVSHICYAQAKIGMVINGVAKDLSEFSYIYSLTGLAEKHSQLSSDGSQAKESLDNVVDNLSNVTATLDNFGTLGSSLAGDEEMRSSMLSLIGNNAVNKAQSLITGQVAKKLAKGRLSGTKGDCETVLKKLGVHKTRDTYLDSIDFNDSVFCVSGSSEIKVVASYTVKLITLLDVDITYDIVQCAATKAWGAASKSNQEIAESIEEDNASENNKQNDKNTEVDEPEETVKRKTNSEIAEACTKNANSNQVLLGSTSIGQANLYKMTYLDVSSAKTLGRENNCDISYITEEFMKQQSAKGKDFFIDTDPKKVSDPILKEQILWLQDKGYKFEKNTTNGLWKAVKN